MSCMNKLRFSSRPWAKVRRQGPPGSARAQTCCYFWRFIKLQYTQSHTSSSEFIFKSLPGDTVVKLLGKKNQTNLWVQEFLVDQQFKLYVHIVFWYLFVLSIWFHFIILYFHFIYTSYCATANKLQACYSSSLSRCTQFTLKKVLLVET